MPHSITPKWFTRTLAGGEVGRDVQVVQRKLGLVSGVYDDETAAYVRGFQQKTGLPVDGMVGPLTAGALGEAADHALTPEWYTGTLSLGDVGEDVVSLRAGLGLSPGRVFDDQTRRAILRFQSAHHLELTGELDIPTALALP